MKTETPKKIDKYEVLDVIGRGGMGVVYKAIDRALDRFVAIKMVTSADEAHGDLLQRFYREAQFTAKLRHQNIVTVYDLGEFSGKPYLVMEYLAGRSLDVMLAGPPLTLQQRIDYIWQVCNGLHYAHSRQPSIIHRDIKPANIVIAEDGTAKIIDFGIARLGKSRNTRTGFVMGSYQYMSPEQISGSELDGRSDIFSTGVVLYQTLTSRLPFGGSTISETLQNIIASPPPALRHHLKEYPARLDEVVTRALAKNREERYQSASEFAFDLLEIEEELKRGLFADYLGRAETLVRSGEYERAKQELAHVLEIDRQHARANELMRKVEQATRKQQRESRAQSLQAHAEDALKCNRLTEALSYLDQAVRLEPANPELQRFRERVLGIKARAEKLTEILGQAERALATENLVEAERAVGEALRFDPESVRAKSFKGIVEARLAGGPASQSTIPRAKQGWKEGSPDPAANTPTSGLDETGLGEWPFAQEGSLTATPTTEAQAAANWPEATLRAVEKQLAVLIGPLAKVIVKKAAARTRNPDEFYNLLAAGIEREGDRKSFLADMRKQATGSKRDPGYQTLRDQVREILHNSEPEETLTPAVVQRAARLLGQYVGPLSGLFTKKAAQIADCERTLYLLLAEHVGDSERARFLHDAGITL
jgi:tetratricopeptide (TPR) repeat protein/predicted Ser/Thr protein kinase